MKLTRRSLFGVLLSPLVAGLLGIKTTAMTHFPWPMAKNCILPKTKSHIAHLLTPGIRKVFETEYMQWPQEFKTFKRRFLGEHKKDS